MNEIVKTEKQLPGTLPELSKFVLVGREKLTAVRAEIRAIEKVGLAKEVHEQKLKEAQAIAEAVLDAEVRIGELTAAIPKASGGDRKSEDFKSNTAVTNENVKPKEEQLADIGLTRQQAQRFETLAKHPEIVEEAKESARRRNDIVNRSSVLKAIANTREPKRDIVKEAKQEHEAFKQAVSEDVISIQQAYTDKQNKRILYTEKAKDTIKLLNSILNYGSDTEPEEAHEMVSQCFSPRESAVFAQECRMAIEIIKVLEGAFNGKTQGN